MQNHQRYLIDKMFEYNLWANAQLIAICGRLSDEQLEVEAAGVYGRIRPTLVHLVRAEGGYVRRLTGSLPWADDPSWDAMPMSELSARARLSGEQLIAVAGEVDPMIPHETELNGAPYHFHNWTVLLQAIYHGIEHRTQIKILLTKLGVAHPELASWDYSESLSSA